MLKINVNFLIIEQNQITETKLNLKTNTKDQIKKNLLKLQAKTCINLHIL